MVILINQMSIARIVMSIPHMSHLYFVISTMTRICTFLFLMLAPSLLSAQEVLKVQHYGVDQGLPQSSVWDIIQDDYGFLWVSTADGLCRFDGYNFTTYRNNQDDSLSIGANSQHLMAIDKEGDLWMTHEQGFDRYHSIKGTFQNLFHYESRINVFNKTIGEDKAGNIWVWIGGEGLLKYDKDNGKLLKKYSFQGKEAWRNQEYSRSALLDNRGKIWITQSGTSTQSSYSLVSFDPKTELLSTLPLASEIYTLCALNDSVMLVGTRHSLLRYNTITNTFNEVRFNFKDEDAGGYSSTEIIQISDTEFWVGTTKGIFIYDDQMRKFTHHYTSLSGGKKNFLFVQTLYRDHSGNIWIGTNGDGLKKYAPKGQPFNHYKSNSDKGDIVKSIYADGKDRVLVGYYDNGFDIFSKRYGFVKKVRVGQSRTVFPGDMVYAMTGLDETKILVSIAGSAPAFGIFNLVDETFTNITNHVYAKIGLRPTANAYPVAVKTPQNKILFNYADALLEVKLNKNLQPDIQLINRFDNEVINTIFEDEEGTRWVGTLNGYYVNSADNSGWKKGNPMLSKQIKTIAEDSEGKMWFGTVNGLYVLDKKGNILQTHQMGKGLINDFIYGILRDNHGDMWFSHNKGITRYDHHNKIFRNFTVEDGLQSNEFNTGAYFKNSTGELFFGGINGVNSFFPEDIQVNQQLPKIQITRVELNDALLSSDTVIWAKKELVFNYDQNTVSFEFAGMEFTEPIKNQYAYRMMGIDKDWIRSGNKRFARYANMPPGKYVFEVKASNNDGVWNENPARMKIVIIPPYWQTTWFRSILVVLALAIVSTIVWLISHQRYLRKLRIFEMKQTIQHDRDRISRELHDNVGAQLSLISSNLDWVANPVSVLSDQERSNRLEDVSRISKDVIGTLRETIWALKKSEILFSDFTDKLKLIVQQQVSILPSVELNFCDDGTDSLLLNPEEALHLLRICQEAIQNSLKHSGLKKLDISWHCKNGKYEICIKDDGHGFNKYVKSNEHYGLENMKQRAEEIEASFTIDTEEGKGTSVSISK